MLESSNRPRSCPIADRVRGVIFGRGSVIEAGGSARKFMDRSRAFDTAVVVPMTGLVFSAYLDAYAHVKIPGTTIGNVATASQASLTAFWFVLTGFLVFMFGRGLSQGRPWNRALPDGYLGSLVAALVFGGALIVDSYFWPFASRTDSLGLDLLFTPPHLVEIASAAVIVSGPLRSAARRGETFASPVTLASAALLLSIFTFATQFIHPLIDPWSATDRTQVPAAVPVWVAQNLGVSAILIQSAMLAGTGLLLNSTFRLRTGSLTLVMLINGLLVTTTKTHYYLLAVPVLTGLAADSWLAWAARRPGRPSASLCAVIAGTFTVAYVAAIRLEGGTAWNPSLWAGVIIAATTLSWMMGRLLRAGLSASTALPAPATGTPDTSEVRWTRDPQSSIRPQLVREALDDLGTPEALGRSPLGRLPGLSKGGSAAADLRSVLVDVIGELATSPGPRDAEAGKLLLDYYVKRVGSHEVIMERLHLSRPTFYRRLQRGFALVAERLDELGEFAVQVPVDGRS